MIALSPFQILQKSKKEPDQYQYQPTRLRRSISLPEWHEIAATETNEILEQLPAFRYLRFLRARVNKRTEPESNLQGSPKRYSLTKANLEAMVGRSAVAETEVDNAPTTTATTKKPARKLNGKTFAMQAARNGIKNYRFCKPPANIIPLQERLKESRSSSPTNEPSQDEFEEYCRKIERATTEITILVETSHLLKEQVIDDKCYVRDYDKSLDAVGRGRFSAGLGLLRPDMMEGLEQGSFAPFEFINMLPDAITVNDETGITLPHLVGEWKREKLQEANWQVAYAGAIMVNVRNMAQTYLKTPDSENSAHVFTFTTDGQTLNIFAHFSSRNGCNDEYHQFKLATVALTNSIDDFKRGMRLLRNVQKMAAENVLALREALINSVSDDSEARSMSASNAVSYANSTELPRTRRNDSVVSFSDQVSYINLDELAGTEFRHHEIEPRDEEDEPRHEENDLRHEENTAGLRRSKRLKSKTAISSSKRQKL